MEMKLHSNNNKLITVHLPQFIIVTKIKFIYIFKIL